MPRTLAVGAFALAALVAAASIGGLMLPEVYARETANWRAQGIGQDWFDLVVLVPLLVACGIGVLRGSRAWLYVLGAALAFTVYTFVLYALAVHFNVLFLVYCAALGVSFFTLAGVLRYLLGHDELRRDAPVKGPGTFLVIVGVAFYALWLADTLPAVWRGEPSAALRDTGLFTNPVHVLDLSIALPLTIAAGVSLLRRRPFGRALAPVMLGFGALMGLSIATLVVVMYASGVTADATPAVAMVAMASIGAALLVRTVRHLRPA